MPPDEAEDPEDVWVIDTSSILWVRRNVPRSKQRAVYRQLGDMVRDGLLYFPRQVLTELEQQTDNIRSRSGSDPPHEWASKHADKATRHRDLHQSLRYVLAVPDVQQLVDPDKPGVEAADPYVVALGQYLKDQGFFVRIITEDRRNKPDAIALAVASGLVGIPVVPMRNFLSSRRIWPAPGGT